MRGSWGANRGRSRSVAASSARTAHAHINMGVVRGRSDIPFHPGWSRRNGAVLSPEMGVFAPPSPFFKNV